MKRSGSYLPWIVIASVVIFAGGHYIAFGDSGKPAANNEVEKFNIALLDVSHVFKEHKRFREQLEEMKKAVAAAEAALQEDANKTRDLIAEAEALNPGEPLKKRLEDEVAERKLRIQLKMETHKKDFMDQEATLYSKVYNEIETAVAEHSRAHGIKLVMRYSEDSLNEHSTRQEVLAGVNRPIVFQDGIDITDEILTRINEAPERGDL